MSLEILGDKPSVLAWRCLSPGCILIGLYLFSCPFSLGLLRVANIISKREDWNNPHLSWSTENPDERRLLLVRQFLFLGSAG